jgi:hypothetical protein
MKSLKFLFAAVILTCFVGVMQTKAQAYVEKGVGYKDIIYEVDGVKYVGFAQVKYQYEWTGSVFNWVARGPLVEAYKLEGWVLQDKIPLPKSTIEVYDAWNYYDERITLNPAGKVLVNAHVNKL